MTARAGQWTDKVYRRIPGWATAFAVKIWIASDSSTGPIQPSNRDSGLPDRTQTPDIPRILTIPGAFGLFVWWKDSQQTYPQAFAVDNLPDVSKALNYKNYHCESLHLILGPAQGPNRPSKVKMVSLFPSCQPQNYICSYAIEHSEHNRK